MYLFDSTARTWSNSESYCNSLSPSAHLTSVHDANENSFLSFLNPTSTAHRWLGATLIRTSTPQTSPFLYTWSDGSSYDYSNFQSGQPSDLRGTSNCLVVTNALAPEWVSVACSALRNGICKRPGLLIAKNISCRRLRK